jgi:uncharacterized membrane protein
MSKKKNNKTTRSRYAQRLERFHSFQAKHFQRRTKSEKIADRVTAFGGSVKFLIGNAVWFFVWLVINLGAIPGIKPFDPFPFVLLTTIVSLEAIFLAIFVLISQNKQAKIADLRQETDLRINTVAEEEITKIMQMCSAIYKTLKKDAKEDPETAEMMKPLDLEEIEERLEKEYEEHQKEH